MPIDYSRYPPNWKTEIVPAVLDRAGNCCENCGLKNKSIVYSVKVNGKSKWFKTIEEARGENIDPLLFDFYISKPVKVVLTIAHLDHDETNHEVKLERLRAWCQLCHLRYDAKEKYRRSLENWKNRVTKP
ncbi:MAG TPA: hypothetical protein VFD46_04475 [Chryseolinea sp.]|nr:hypothetical protein [Chryseolinea sp.]